MMLQLINTTPLTLLCPICLLVRINTHKRHAISTWFLVGRLYSGRPL